MNIIDPVINGTIRGLFRLFYRFDPAPLRQVPMEGPLIITANHTHFLDAPLLYVYMQPRTMVAMAKKQLWDHAVTRFIMHRWKTIPVDRDAMGRETMNACFTVLKNRDILAIAPEGTRSRSGVLQEGKSGVAYIAYREKAPIIPMVTLGFEDRKAYRWPLRRTPLHIAVGPAYRIIDTGSRLSAQGREELMQEIMMRIAVLLPEEKRGIYRDMEIQYVHTEDITLT